MSFLPNKTFAAASLLLLGSMAAFMLSFQQQTSLAWFGREMHDQRFFKGDHTHGGHHNNGAVAAEEPLELWEGDWYETHKTQTNLSLMIKLTNDRLLYSRRYGPYTHSAGEWRVFYIPMHGDTCCCRTWCDPTIGGVAVASDTDLFMTSNPDIVLSPAWQGWEAIAVENGAHEFGIIRNNAREWNCYAAVYGVIDSKRCGILCDDSGVNRIDMDSKPDWAA